MDISASLKIRKHLALADGLDRAGCSAKHISRMTDLQSGMGDDCEGHDGCP
jgi:hypothetical protein